MNGQLKDGELMTRFEYKSIQLFKAHSLGIGSYGAVCKAKCDDLLCAAKILHPTLFDPSVLHQLLPHKREHRLPIRRFEQECEFMSAVRHPNIVQYLGLFRDTSTHLPVLLMELMDDSLTHFLESSSQPVPFHIQVNICHDIALALSYLHSNNIVHRDLSSNNVLLRGNILAKVSDFGMARLSDINLQATHFTNTMCPGTDVYMPPEAVQDKPVYTEKIDCFSFGVIATQILTQKFPNPSDRLERIEVNLPGLPTGKVLVEIPEVNRRQNHISEIAQDHPLLRVIFDCLKDKDFQRPSAQQLCETVVELKETLRYTDSAKTVQDMEEVVQSLALSLEEKDHAISSREEENQQLKDQLQKGLREKDEEIEHLQQENDRVNRKLGNREIQLRRLKQQLEEAEHVVAQFERRITELEQQIEQNQEDQQILEASRRAKQVPNIKLRWRKGKNAPHAMSRCSDSVVSGNVVYFKNADTAELHSYDVITESWSQLPDCIEEGCSITSIDGLLTTVGGFNSNELFSLTGEGSSRMWTKMYPPMPTKRYFTTPLCIGTALIVAGGQGKGRKEQATVEVMNTKSHKWSTAADLPQPMFFISAAVCGNRIYMLGGHDIYHSMIKSVYTCSVSDLLKSSESPKLVVKKSSTLEKASVWRQVADLPVISSNCEFFNGNLLAIGGLDDSMKPSSAVYRYNSTINLWEFISHMSDCRYRCFTGVLPDNRLMVVGGCLDYTYSIYNHY